MLGFAISMAVLCFPVPAANTLYLFPKPGGSGKRKALEQIYQFLLCLSFLADY